MKLRNREILMRNEQQREQFDVKIRVRYRTLKRPYYYEYNYRTGELRRNKGKFHVEKRIKNER